MSSGGKGFITLPSIFTKNKNLAHMGIPAVQNMMGLSDEEDDNAALDPLNIFGFNTKEEEAVPITPPTTTAAAEATAAEEAAAKARRDFLAKQALLVSRNKTVKTNTLGNASDTLQTNRKALLGGGV
jgi:hypothetical protein